MDFLSLSRKELQALCKKNKIPANMTNIAMAEALKDLQTVEGLDDIMNQSQINPPRSPGNPITGSQEIPHSITRTSTRRKPTKEEPQSLQPTTRTRRGPRRAITEEMDQENKSVNVPETPAMPSSRRRATSASACQRSKTHVKKDKEDEKLVGQGKNDDIKTPSVQSSRRRAPAASSRSKAEEGSVQCAYSTRRSVRLLEKSLTDSSLKEKETTEPVKIDELGKDMAVGEEKNDAAGIDLKTISDESSEKANDYEVFSGRNLSESLENERDLIDDIQETDIGDDDYKMEAQADYQISNNLNGISVPDIHVAEDLMEKAADVHGAFADEKGSYNLVDLSVLDAKDSAHVMADEPDVQVGEDLMEKAEDVNGAFAEEKGTDDVPVEVSDHVAPAKPAMLQEIDNLVSGEVSAVLISSTMSSCEDQDEKPDNQCQKLGIEEAYDESMADEKPDNHFQKLALEEAYDESMEDEKTDSLSQRFDIEEACDESMEDDLRVGNDLESKFNTDEESSDEVFDEKPSEFIQSVTDDETEVECTTVNAFLGDANFLNDFGSEKLIAYQLEKQDTVESSGGHTGDQSAKKEVYNNKAFVGTDVAESEEYDLTSTDSYSPLDNSPTSGKQTSPFPVVSETEAEGDITLALMQEIANVETSVEAYVKSAEQFSVAINELPPSSDKTPTSVKQMSPTSPLVSGDTVTGGNQLLIQPFAEKSISGQFPRPTLLPATKSSSKKHTTIQNLTDVADNINNKKENINCEMKVEPKNNKMIKKNIDGDTLKGISLRKLTRMVKELEITNHTKNDEDKMVAKVQVGKSRPALQTLPENRMPAAEQEKEN